MVSDARLTPGSILLANDFYVDVATGPACLCVAAADDTSTEQEASIRDHLAG